jgi:hypothetical protein
MLQNKISKLKADGALGVPLNCSFGSSQPISAKQKIN